MIEIKINDKKYVEASRYLQMETCAEEYAYRYELLRKRYTDLQELYEKEMISK